MGKYKERKLRHIAIIMDGNGRWARKRWMPRVMGHIAGVKTVKKIVQAALDNNIEVLTLYAFSTENWKRSKLEVTALMKLLAKEIKAGIDLFLRNRIKLRVSGRLDELPDVAQKELKKAVERTSSCERMVLNLAINYGGRREIVDAAQKLAADVICDRISVEDIDEDAFSRALYTSGLPDPDILIRTSGEKRISNFLLWQLSYTEFYFLDCFWPDFTEKHFEDAINDFKGRERRFGAS